MKVTILTENKSERDDLVAEEGFCAYIEAGGFKILFDTAIHGGFMANADKLNVDLLKTTHIVLSHGHNDHTKGLLAFISNEKYKDELKKNEVKLIMHPGSLLKKRKYISEAEAVEISCLHSCELNEYFELLLSKVPVEISEDIFFLGQIPCKHDFEGNHFIGDILIDGKWEPDYMLEDSAVAIKTEKGLVIVAGCSHRGICNIVDYAKKVTGEDRVADIIGGLHLRDADDENIEETAKTLSMLGAYNVHACHCTGERAAKRLSETFKMHKTSTGSVLDY